MNNFFKQNPSQNMAYYPQPIQIDEETGKVSMQNLNETPQHSDSQNISTDNANAQQNFQPKQTFPNGMNMEKIMSMLKGGSSNDMLSALLANGMNGNGQQNPMMMQALSKLMNGTKKSDTSVTQHTQSMPTFQEM